MLLAISAETSNYIINNTPTKSITPQIDFICQSSLELYNSLEKNHNLKAIKDFSEISNTPIFNALSLMKRDWKKVISKEIEPEMIIIKEKGL